jgi:hypothetical protein
MWVGARGVGFVRGARGLRGGMVKHRTKSLMRSMICWSLVLLMNKKKEQVLTTTNVGVSNCSSSLSAVRSESVETRRNPGFMVTKPSIRS